jgi:hypothetical protein
VSRSRLPGFIASQLVRVSPHAHSRGFNTVRGGSSGLPTVDTRTTKRRANRGASPTMLLVEGVASARLHSHSHRG